MLAILLPYDPGATDAFEPGFFRWERRDHVPVPVRAWYGPPIDPLTGERLDRSWRWQFEFNGLPLEVYASAIGLDSGSILESFWPRARGSKIPGAEYEYLIATRAHALDHDAGSPFASTRGRIDLLSSSIPSFGG